MTTQALRTGRQYSVRREERYRCLNPECLCEIKISREPFIGVQITHNPRCCCGNEMEKVR